MNNHQSHDSEDARDMDAVSRAYRDARDRDADHMTPPAALDDAIRAAARRAVHARPQPVGKSWIRQWTPQLAVAAVVVLSVSVVFVAIEEKPELAPPPIQKMTQARRADAPAATIAPREPRVAETTLPATMAADAIKKKSAVASGAGADAGTDTGAVSANMQEARQKDSAPAKEELNVAAGATLLPPQQAIAAPASMAPAAPVYSPPSPAVANVPPAPFPAADAIAPGRKESRADANLAAPHESKLVAEKVTIAGAMRSAEVASAPAKPVASGGASTLASAAPTALARPQLAPSLATTPATIPAATVAPAPPRAASLDRARSEMQTSSAAGFRSNATETYQSSRKPDESESPGPWLKRLLELREKGKLKELREELVRFRKVHPDVVLPKALSELPAE